MIITVIITCSVGFRSLGQDSSNHKDCVYTYDSAIRQNIYTYADRMPEYPGGSAALIDLFLKNYKYEYTGKENFQGSLKMEFIIDERGQIICPAIKSKSLKDITDAEAEAIRVLGTMPRWKPGSCNGRTVAVKEYLPITFDPQ